jgi:hypothetical protein
MSYKKEIGINIIIIFILNWLVWLMLRNQEIFSEAVRQKFTWAVYAVDIEYFFAPVFLSLLSILFILFFLFFISESIYHSWRKFALWYVPLSILITVNSGTQSQSGGLLPSDAEFLTYFFPIVFLLISLILIIYKSIKLKGK